MHNRGEVIILEQGWRKTNYSQKVDMPTVLTATLSLVSGVTLVKLYNLSKPQYPLEMRMAVVCPLTVITLIFYSRDVIYYQFGIPKD